MKIGALAALALSLSLVSASARAQEESAPPPPPASTSMVGGLPAPGAFGSLGQLVISTDLPLGMTDPMLALIHTSTSMGGGSSTAYGIAPSLDYFVAPNVSIGGMIGVAHGDAAFDNLVIPGASITTIDVAARIGYNLTLTDAFSLWPRLSLGYEHLSMSGGGSSGSGYVVPLVVFVPVLWHPAQHFFVGLGPVLSTDLISKVDGNSAGKTTNVGIEAVLGGYFAI